MRILKSALVLCVLLLSSSCDEKKASEQNAASTNAANTNPSIVVDGEHLTVAVTQLSQQAVLSALATQLGFRVDTQAPLNKTISLNIQSATLRYVLQQTLEGSPYQLTLTYRSHMDYFPSVVTITAQTVNSNAQHINKKTEPVAASAAAPLTKQPTQSQQQMKEFHQKMLVNNASPEPDFLKDMTGTKEDAARVMPMLTDPNRSFDDKEAIIDMLQDGEHADVIAPLNAALQDKNPEVVQAAIDAIVGFGEESDIGTLKKLLETTQNADVRQAAEDAIAALE